MATVLYRLGRTAFRHRRWVVLLWVALLGLAFFGAARAPAADDSGPTMPGTESQRAFDLMDQRFPGGKADGAEARIVFVAPAGQKVTVGANRQSAEKVLREITAGTRVADTEGPFEPGTVSKDGTTAYATVVYQDRNVTDAAKETLDHAIDDGRRGGLRVEVGGSALEPNTEFGGVTEIVGVGVAALVLVLTFGSLAAAGLPLVTALIGVGAGIMTIIAAALSSSATILAMMLGTAVGIDYAMFIVSRYREERGATDDAEEAAGRATGTAGSAVVFAGLTVVIALAGLSVVGIPTLTTMGLAGSGTVAIAVLVALTLVPALLGFVPRATLPRRARRGAARHQEVAASAGTRWARLVLRRPLAVLIFAVLGLGIVAMPALDLRLGIPGDESQPTSTTQRRAYDALADGFGPGFNGPLTIVIDAKDARDPKAAADSAARRLKETRGIVSVSPPVLNQAGDTALLKATPSSGPTTAETRDLVRTVRDDAARFHAATGATMLVTGTTAMNIDISQKVTDALLPYLAVVVGLAFLLLMVIFRSILVPLKAALGFLLSVAAAFGAIVAVFQWGWFGDLLGVEQTGPVMSFMPIITVGITFGLAMDYEVFLVSRMREAYTHGAHPHQAIVAGFRHSARVVAAAAAIMIAVFAGFIGSSDPIIKMMGVGLPCAVFFDAFVVRMAIVPAVLALLGHRAWRLPSRLHRILPRVDIEGAKLPPVSRTRLAAVPDGDQSPAEPEVVTLGMRDEPVGRR